MAVYSGPGFVIVRGVPVLQSDSVELDIKSGNSRVKLVGPLFADLAYDECANSGLGRFAEHGFLLRADLNDFHALFRQDRRCIGALCGGHPTVDRFGDLGALQQ